MLRPLGRILGPLALLLVTLSSAATQLEYRDLPALGGDAATVVRGEVIAVQSRWNDAGTRILTDVVLRVDESYKGATTSELRIVQPGGVVDGVRMTVHGAARFTVGAQVLVFAEDAGDGAHRLSGFTQGKFDLARDARGRWVATRPALDLTLVGAPSAKSAARFQLDLDTLLDRSLGTDRGGR